MENLSKLAEAVVLGILGVPTFSEDAVKQTSVSTFNDLYHCSPPDGYHIASYDEIIKLMKNYQMNGKKLFFPIYAEIKSGCRIETKNYTVYFYKSNSSSSKLVKSSIRDHSYCINSVTGRFITNIMENSVFNLSYNDDRGYSFIYNDWNQRATASTYRTETQGLIDMSTPMPSISAGYVYFLKNK